MLGEITFKIDATEFTSAWRALERHTVWAEVRECIESRFPNRADTLEVEYEGGALKIRPSEALKSFIQDLR